VVDVTRYLLAYLLAILFPLSETFSFSVSAMIGATLIAWFGLSDGLFSYEEALSFIDIRLLAFLIGIMITVESVNRSGLFRVVGLYIVKRAGRKPSMLFFTLSILAAATSMLLADEAALLLVTAVIISVADILGWDPVPYVVAAAIMVNLGGTGTLIGSTSNMIIGLSAGLSFPEFAEYLLPCEVALWFMTALVLYLCYRRRVEGMGLPARAWEPGELAIKVEDYPQLAKAAVILALMLALYISSENLGIPAEAVAILTATLALASMNFDPVEIYQRVDWETVFFVAAFMFLVNAMSRTGLMQQVATTLAGMAQGSPTLTTMYMLFVSGVLSIFLENVAVALTFTPVVRELPLPDKRAVWAALVLGTNLGGATLPATSLVFVMAMGALRHRGVKIDTGEFIKVGALTTSVQLVFAALYLLLYFGVAA